MTNFIGIDPGERWVGLAGLRQMTGHWQVYIAVADLREQGFHPAVKRIQSWVSPETRVVCEDYRVRPQGFNRWGAHPTLRLLGAIEFATIENGGGFHLVPPGKHEDLHKLAFGNVALRYWRDRWNQWGNEKWNHGLSAWRALAVFMAQHHPRILEIINPGLGRVQRMKYSDQRGHRWIHWPDTPYHAPIGLVPEL